MKACPEIVVNRPKPRCKVSMILIDWSVRESFHALEYLNRQTAPRDDYELIWLEFYRNKPGRLADRVERGVDGRPALDKWIVAGYPQEYIFNKHRLYNLGILAAEGDICVICDSDAMFTPNFIEKVVAAFQDQPRLVLHLDEIRNRDHCFFPFRYPSFAAVMGPGCSNWNGTTSLGLVPGADMLHEANYGACMAARRADLLAVGGADEQLDYLGYVCGPYELTFRLLNQGFTERWLRDEYLYHTWHPNENSINTDYQGPHDGRMMAARAMHARASGRIEPWLENPWIAQARQGVTADLPDIMGAVARRTEPTWHVDAAPRSFDDVYLIERDFHGFNLYIHQKRCYALPIAEGAFDPRRRRHYPTLLRENSIERLRNIVEHYTRLPTTFWARLWAEPFYRLPERAVKHVMRRLARLW